MRKIIENKKYRNILFVTIVLILFILTNVIYFAITSGPNVENMSDEELLTYCLDLNDDELTDFLTSIDKTEATRAMNLINAYQILEAMNDDAFTDESSDDVSVQEAVEALSNLDINSNDSSEDGSEESESNELSEEEAQALIDAGIITPIEDVEE